MPVTVRALEQTDRAQWDPLWLGYNLFYDRPNFSAEVTNTTWARFFDPQEPVFAAIAEIDRKLVGLVHYLFHRSTTSIEPVSYLQDLFTAPEARGQGIATDLIRHVYHEATQVGTRRVYWQTHEDNPARKLYDKMAALTPFRRYLYQIP